MSKIIVDDLIELHYEFYYNNIKIDKYDETMDNVNLIRINVTLYDNKLDNVYFKKILFDNKYKNDIFVLFFLFYMNNIDCGLFKKKNNDIYSQ